MDLLCCHPLFFGVYLIADPVPHFWWILLHKHMSISAAPINMPLKDVIFAIGIHQAIFLSHKLPPGFL